MNLQYLSDENGQITAVQIPIKDWENIKDKYFNIEKNDKDLPDWQRELIDIRQKLTDQNAAQAINFEIGFWHPFGSHGGKVRNKLLTLKMNRLKKMAGRCGLFSSDIVLGCGLMK